MKASSPIWVGVVQLFPSFKTPSVIVIPNICKVEIVRGVETGIGEFVRMAEMIMIRH